MIEAKQTDGVETFGGFSDRGHLNAALYPPGVPCDAMGGSPVNKNCFSVVFWYPGTWTEMHCFGDQDEARAFIRKVIR